MPKDLSHYRKTYRQGELSEKNAPEHPMDLFQQWFNEIDASGSDVEANAMTVATLGPDGYPKNRVVLLKKYSRAGFVFYTNYRSEKGSAIEADPKVCLSFFWPGAERQVIIKGKAEKTAEAVSDAYFKSRPEGSKLGAIASPQSEVIPSREILEKKLRELRQRYKGKDIPRPKHWGGYLVKPVSLEFWQGRPNRLHDRILYTLQKDRSWKIERLAP